MFWLKKRSREAAPPAFVQCPTCTYDFITGEGTRNCHYGECPYLPEAYKVNCPVCNYNFATHEGQPACSDPPTCEFAKDGAKHASAARKRFSTP